MVLVDSDLFVFGARVANFWDMDMEEVSARLMWGAQTKGLG